MEVSKPMPTPSVHMYSWRLCAPDASKAATNYHEESELMSPRAASPAGESAVKSLAYVASTSQCITPP